MRPLVRVTYWSNSIGRGDGPAVVGRQFLVPGASPHRAGDGRADGVGRKRQVLRLMEGPQLVRVPAGVARGGAGLLLELLLLLCWQVSPRKVRVADNLQRDHAGLSDLLEDQRARREAERTVRWPWRALRMLLSLGTFACCTLSVISCEWAPGRPVLQHAHGVRLEWLGPHGRMRMIGSR